MALIDDRGHSQLARVRPDYEEGGTWRAARDRLARRDRPAQDHAGHRRPDHPALVQASGQSEERLLLGQLRHRRDERQLGIADRALQQEIVVDAIEVAGAGLSVDHLVEIPLGAGRLDLRGVQLTDRADQREPLLEVVESRENLATRDTRADVHVHRGHLPREDGPDPDDALRCQRPGRAKQPVTEP